MRVICNVTMSSYTKLYKVRNPYLVGVIENACSRKSN
jgi:hypothetical protein